MLSNARMYYVATVQQRKKSSSTKASSWQTETSNTRDEESAGQIRLSAMPAHVVIQRSDVPACRAGKTVLVQPLSEACPPEPHRSFLLRRTTAASGHHICRGETACSIHRDFDSLAEQRSYPLPFVTTQTVNSVAAPAAPHPPDLILLWLVRVLQRSSPRCLLTPRNLQEKESPCPTGKQPVCFRSSY